MFPHVGCNRLGTNMGGVCVWGEGGGEGGVFLIDAGWCVGEGGAPYRCYLFSQLGSTFIFQILKIVDCSV